MSEATDYMEQKAARQRQQQEWLDSLEVSPKTESVAPDESIKLNGPPGTGKSTELVRRLSLLESEYDINLRDITWITFRRDLAEDVFSKLREAAVLNEDDFIQPTKGRTRHIGTLHSVAMRVAGKGEWMGHAWGIAERQDYVDFLSEKYGRHYDTPDTEAWDESPGKRLFEVYHWLIHNQRPFSKHYEAPSYDRLRSCWNTHPPLSEVAASWEDYKSENKLFDFHEMLTEALDSEELPPQQVVIVDEYHDFTPLMDSVARKWLAGAEIAIVAGDPHQVMNRHEGADPKYFERLPLPELQLPTTWRVPKNIWDAATTILGRTHTPPALDIASDKPGEILVRQAPPMEFNRRTGVHTTSVDKRFSPPDLLYEFSQEGPLLSGDGGAHAASHDENTILYLARTQLQIWLIGLALRKTGIIYAGQQGTGAWNKNLDRAHLYNGLQRFRGLTCEQRGWKRWTLILSEEALLDEPPTELCAEEAQALLKATPSSLLAWDRDETAALGRAWVNDELPVTLQEFFAPITDPIRWTELFSNGPVSVKHCVIQNTRERNTLQAALARNRGLIPTFENQGRFALNFAGFPRVMSLHGSKGFEADTVILYDGITRRIRNELYSPAARASEDRIWYVGCTRAKERVVVLRDGFSWTSSYIPYGIQPTRKGDE
ncbi:UvrD-helicase domain-containing protein [Halorarius halobius]|uniref:UvrD-helicase domain-containing protein n=1 Tax=Halorarius halobius TaxID=2962671 RepID=UPI0020CF821B|nr:UvrD-helicase domain-containing protein [Halorarius halobius]